ncbi:MAG: hypothetical protein IPP20_10790 [Gemmatimonadetes bacterium]|nr:hypothetical protein [Gemmatimonadota bacterium]
MLTLIVAPVLSVALGALSLPNALLFEAVRDQAGHSVLFIRDCGRGNIPRDVGRFGVSNCESYQKRFASPGWYPAREGKDSVWYDGDSLHFAGALRGARFEEVWLFSGGGNLNQGIEIGRLLRRARMTVRVPNVARVRTAMQWPSPSGEVACVSACTVAFMGGLFRYLDPDATYEVHSASIAATALDPRLIAQMASGKLRDLVEQECLSARFMAARLFTHFQNTLLLTTANPQRSENLQDFMRFARAGGREVPYAESDELRDLTRIRDEGLAAMQDIYMRIERQCMNAAIASLRERIGDTEPRARPALRMLEVMYEVSIKDTASLTRETMLRMGYLTQEIDPGVRP